MYTTVEKSFIINRRVYRGPSLPFVKDNKIVFLASNEDEIGEDYCDFVENARYIVEFELASIGLENDYEVDDIDYETFRECEDHLYDEEDEDTFIVVTLPLRRTPFIECSHCGFAPKYADKECAYMGIPLNEDVWDEWICKDCTSLE